MRSTSHPAGVVIPNPAGVSRCSDFPRPEEREHVSCMKLHGTETKHLSDAQQGLGPMGNSPPEL